MCTSMIWSYQLAPLMVDLLSSEENRINDMKMQPICMHIEKNEQACKNEVLCKRKVTLQITLSPTDNLPIFPLKEPMWTTNPPYIWTLLTSNTPLRPSSTPVSYIYKDKEQSILALYSKKGIFSRARAHTQTEGENNI